MEKFTKWFLYSFQITFVFLMLPTLVITLFMFFTKGLRTEDYQLPFYGWLPFNWRTPIGYLIAYALQCGGVYYLFMRVVFATGFMAIFTAMLVIFAEDAKEEVKIINEINKTSGNEIETIKRFHELIQYHADAKQLVSDFNDIYEYMLLTLLIWGVINVCGTLLIIQIQLSQEHTDWASLVISCWQLFWTFCLLFLNCYRGEEVTGAFEEVADEFYQCEWFSFPNKLQRIIPILTINGQQPVKITAYGGYSCSHERFQTIVKGGYSYYTILREFY
ncbi:putative odorant receptor 85d [Contarinia nasturtii]|uniref:putative odorant receptor 85d n=1 Tax=Contarinia nasturtii TaxID=265458 RepID=UPI0012D47E77|nr:putative odorant receptor 85d [Contarinia nasturtii]